MLLEWNGLFDNLFRPKIYYFVKNTLIKFKNKNSNSFPISSYSLLISIERFTCPSANHKMLVKMFVSNRTPSGFVLLQLRILWFISKRFTMSKNDCFISIEVYLFMIMQISHNEWVCLHGKRIANLISIIAWKISYLFNGNGNNGFAFLFRILLLVLPIMTVNQSFVWFAACDFEVNLGFSQKSNHGSILTILSFFGITPIISLFFHSLTLSPC